MTPRAHVHNPSLFISRELSWLAFNERVLAEAADPSVPLLERVKFAAIAASNLDEFFMVRVAALKRSIDDEDMTPDLDGRTPAQLFADASARAQAFVAALSRLVAGDLRPSLASQGIRLLSWNEIEPARQAGLGTYFAESVLPVLTPLAIDISRPFPLLSSLSLNLALRLEPEPGETVPRLAIVQVPPRLTRLVRLAEPEGFAFVLLEDIIRAHLTQLFPGQPVIESAVIRLARDAELELDDEGGRTHLELVERQVRQRRRSDVVRVEVEDSASQELIDLLRDQLEVEPSDIYVQPGPLDLRVLMGLTEVPGFDAMRDPPHQPVDVLAGEQADLMSVLDERDVLLHHPYNAYDPVLALLAEAAEDQDVLAIKQTLYRASAGSSIIRSLKRAAECNKQVTVLVELTARFDEERNIQWARSLEEAGAHVIYGVRGYKTHAKVCLIVRRGPQGLRRYVHLGTGNYNEQSARIYTDFGLLTSSPALAEDASAFFSAVTGYSDPPRLRKLVMAPTDLRRRFLKLIDRERRRAEEGLPAEIVAKMNSLIDDEIIETLYTASRSGVRIQLNVRGICALRPGVPGASETIEVVSVVDRFLEHSRVYYFLNGGDEEVYLASADWMTRNLDKRLELMWPVEHAGHKARVIGALRAMFRDTAKAWILKPDGSYERKQPSPGETPFRVQQALQDEARRTASLARDAAGIRFVPERK
jgi:polyphosphate kinase